MKIAVRGLGPFDEAEVELAPLTLFIGRNTVGKSFLAYLIWTLSSLTPDFEAWIDAVADSIGSERLSRLTEEIVEEAARGREVAQQFKELARVFLEAFPKALRSSLRERLEKTFGCGLGELLGNRDEGEIRVETHAASVTFKLRPDGIEPSYARADIAGPIHSLSIDVSGPGMVTIRWDGDLVERTTLRASSDVFTALFSTLARIVVHIFDGWVAVTETGSCLLVDGRAGIARTLLRPYIDPTVARGMLMPDEAYVRLYHRLAEDVAKGRIDVKPLAEFLAELGIRVGTSFERGTYVLKVVSWTGHTTTLETASSGVRESLLTALALVSRLPLVVIVEEPEAHLHPRAQRLLARLIINAINRYRKRVVVTTHSDYMLYAINNLLLRGELGRELVRAYLIERGDGLARVKALEVGDEGISEEAFEEVVRELAEERADALEKRG